jgi:integrase
MAYLKEIVGKKGITYRVGWRNPQGKEKYQTFKKKTPAMEWKRKVEYALDTGTYQELIAPPAQVDGLTLSQLADEYLETCKREKGFAIKTMVLRSLLRTTILSGERIAAEITYTDLVRFKTKRLNTPTKSGKNRALSTWNNELAVLSCMFKYGKTAKLIPVNPLKEEEAKSLKAKHNNARLRFLTEKEIPIILEACATHLRPLVEMALLTGMRRGELFGLTWDMIVNGNIHLPGWLTKNSNPRNIPISRSLAQILDGLRRKNQLKSKYVFCNEQGGRLLDIRAAFQGACRRAGIEDFTFHDLRHTFASHLVMAGRPLKEVCELLGHKDIQMTMRYAHLAPEYLEAGVNSLNHLVSADKNSPADKLLTNSL